MLVLFLTLCLLQALASPSASSSTLAPAVAVANLRAHELQRPPHIPFLNPPLTTPSVPRPNLRLRGGARFASRWSEEYKAAQIQLEEEGLVAYNPEVSFAIRSSACMQFPQLMTLCNQEPNFDFNDGAPPAAWSIRVSMPAFARFLGSPVLTWPEVMPGARSSSTPRTALLGGGDVAGSLSSVACAIVRN